MHCIWSKQLFFRKKIKWDFQLKKDYKSWSAQLECIRIKINGNPFHYLHLKEKFRFIFLIFVLWLLFCLEGWILFEVVSNLFVCTDFLFKIQNSIIRLIYFKCSQCKLFFNCLPKNIIQMRNPRFPFR